MYHLAWELAKLGKRVLVTTTTHIVRPACGPVLEIEHMSQVTELAWKQSVDAWKTSEKGRERSEETSEKTSEEGWQSAIVTAGRRKQQPGGGIQKLAMPEGLDMEQELDRLLTVCDVVLIEADGAACYPVKVPRQGEPVILPRTQVLIGCMGLSGLGQTWKDGCFRFESDGRWLECCAKDRILPEELARILSEEQGTKKHLPAGTCRYQILLNQADDQEKVEMAKKVVFALPEALQKNCIVTGYEIG